MNSYVKYQKNALTHLGVVIVILIALIEGNLNPGFHSMQRQIEATWPIAGLEFRLSAYHFITI